MRLSLIRSHLFFCSDPESEIPFAEALYGNVAVMQSFYNSLGSNGILIMQLGESPNVWDPDETYSKHKNRVAVMELLETVGFKSVHAYEEVSHSRQPDVGCAIDWSDIDAKICHLLLLSTGQLWLWRCVVVCGCLQSLRNSEEMV